MKLRAHAWIGALAGLGLVAVIAIGAPSAIGAHLLAADGPVPAQPYKFMGAHAMLTEAGYRAKLRGADFLGAGSVPVGNKLVYGGGPVLTRPKVYITFWDWKSDPQNVKPYLTGFFAGVGGSDWMASQDQYCQHVTALATNCAGGQAITSPPDQLAGVWDDHQDQIPANPLAEPNVGNSPPISDEAARAVAHFGYYQDGIYIIATPHGISTAGFAANSGAYCAWHGALQLADGSRVQFVNLPYMPDGGSSCGQDLVNPDPQGILDPVTVAAGHEYAETITDPTVSFDSAAVHGYSAPGWYDPDPVAGGENGDKCAYPLSNVAGIQGAPGGAVDITLNGKPYAVQPLWSNNANDYAGGCVTSYTPPPDLPVSTTADTGAPAFNSNTNLCRGAQITDAAGDAIDPYLAANVTNTDQTSLDVLNVRFSTPNPSTLEIRTTVDNLQPFPQGDTLAGIWSVYWNYGGQTHVASVSSDATGVVYEDGVHTSAPMYPSASAVLTTVGTYSSGDNDVYSNTGDTGSFNPGPNGSVVIDVPLSHIGSPASGAVLSKPWAVAYGAVANAVSSSAPAVPTAGNHWTQFISDEAPDSNPVDAADGAAGPYTGWPYTVGTATSCNQVRQLPPPPADLYKPPPPPPLADNCTPEWTNAPGNEELPPTGAFNELAGQDVQVAGVTTGQDPQLDLLAEYLSVSHDAKALRVRLVIENLSTMVAPGATDNAYYAYFTVNGKQYFAQTQVDLLGDISYAYGTIDTTGPTQTGTPQGSFTQGPNGVIEVDVPLSAIGNPKLGTHVEHNGARAVAVEGAVIIDVSDGAAGKFPNFNGLTYVMSTAACAQKTAPVAHVAQTAAPAAAGGASSSAAPVAAAPAVAAPARAAASAPTAAPKTPVGRSVAPKPAAPAHAATQAVGAKLPVPLVAVLAAVGLAALGAIGALVYRRRLI